MTRVIDEMPTRQQVINAEPYQLVCWHLFLRPTMMNEELDIVKAITRRYDNLPEGVRSTLGAQARREYA